MPLALVTNGDARQQRDKIDRYDLSRWFDAIQQWAQIPVEAAADLIGALVATENNRGR